METRNPLFALRPPVVEDAADEDTGELAPESTAMTDSELRSAMHEMVSVAIDHVEHTLSPERAKAARYYKGEPFGNEETGRSQIVITELRDTVLMIMPSLMRLFFGAERPIEYGPRNAMQVEPAQQMTDYVWDIVVQEDNEGFLRFYEWFKDALVKRLGVMKVWYDNTPDIQHLEGAYLTVDKLLELEQDPSVIAIDEVTPSQGVPMGPLPLYDVKFTRQEEQGRIRFLPVPPEEFLYTPTARTVSATNWVPGVAQMVGHRTEMTRSQLRDLGISEDDIRQYAFPDASLDTNVEEIARQDNVVRPDIGVSEANRTALYIEAYPYLDYDGDGFAELRKIVMLGSAFHIVSNEPCARRPFAVLCPDPEPHTVVGQGVSDWTMDLQLVESSIWRSVLDSLALSIHPRLGYVEGAVSLADILNTEIGAPIRMKSANALTPVQQQFVGNEALPLLDRLQEVRENRSGVTKASAGLDADSLQSTTKAAVAATITSAQAHIEMIARIFAETGVRSLFSLILQAVAENPPAPRILRSQGKYVEIDPRSWDANLDVRVKVAIGAGMDDEKYQALLEAREEMKFVLTTFGLSNPVVTLKQYRDTNVKMLKLRGRMDAEAFYQDVDPNWQPPPPPVQDPNMVIAQAEQHKAETQRMVAESKAQLDMQRQQMDMQAKIDQLRLQLQQVQERNEIELQKAALQAQTQLAVAEINKQAQVQQAQMNDTIQRVNAILNHLAKLDKNTKDNEVDHRELDIQESQTEADTDDEEE